MDLDIELTLDMVAFILQQKNEEELEEDLELKKIIMIIFEKNNTIDYPEGRDPKLLLKKFIEIIYKIFKFPKNIRNSLYGKKTNEITDKELSKLIKYIKINEDANIIDEKSKNLYEKIKKFNSNEGNSLFEFLNMLTYYISFILQEKFLFLFSMCSLINEKILSKYNRKFELNELEIDCKDEVCLSFLSEIFSNELKDEKLLIFCLIALKFRTIRSKLNGANKSIIINSIENILLKQNEIINNLNNDEIIDAVCEEFIDMQNKKINKPEICVNKNDNKADKENMKINFRDPCDLNSENNIKFWDNNILDIKKLLFNSMENLLNKVVMNKETKEELDTHFKKLQDFMDKIIQKNNWLSNELNSIKNNMKENEQKLRLELGEMKEKEKKMSKELGEMKEKEKKTSKELEEMKENLREKEQKFNLKMDQMKYKENELNSKVNNLEIQVSQLKEESKQKDNKINYIIKMLSEIYQNLICPISLAIFEGQVVTPNGVT